MVDAVVGFLNSVKEDPQFSDDLYVTTGTMFTDEEVTNVWLDYETGLPPQDPFVWFFAEPNGGTVENCAQVWIKEESTGKTSGFNDPTCSSPPVACQDIGKVTLTFRGYTLLFSEKFRQKKDYLGLCRQSAIDTTYSMARGDVNKKRFFSGNRGWKLYWEQNTYSIMRTSIQT